MGLRDWIRNRGVAEKCSDPELDPKTYGHKSWKAVFAEMRQDEALAKQRDETGKEPESRNPKAKSRGGNSLER